MAPETFEHSKANVAMREAAAKRRQRWELLTSVLVLLVLAGRWSFQQVTGTSILDFWEALSVGAKLTLVLVPLVGVGATLGIGLPKSE